VSDEPEVEGLPPRDKPFAEYTEAEWDATHVQGRRAIQAAYDRRQRESAEREARQRELENRRAGERHGDLLRAMGDPLAKHRANAEFARRIHGGSGLTTGSPSPSAGLAPESYQLAAVDPRRPVPLARSADEPGWVEVEIEDGASLMFPGLNPVDADRERGW
jgi:hypothetical protein